MVEQISLEEDVDGRREMDRGCVSGTGCSRSGFVSPCLQVPWKQRVPPLSNNAAFVKLLDIVQTNVNRTNGDNIRHFAGPYPLEE